MSLTDPYSDDTPQLLKRSLSHIVRAKVVTADGTEIPVEVEEARTVWDETRAPRVEAAFTCRVPTDQAVLDSIDPRLGQRFVIDAGYMRPGGVEDVQTIANLSLRSRVVSRPADLMEIGAISDESLVIDNSASTSLTVNQASTTAAITWVLGLVIPGISPTVSGPTGAAINQSSLSTDKWETVQDLADRIEAQVYDNGLRQWFIAPMPVIGTPVHTIAVGADGTLISSEAGLERDGWANRVFLHHEWVDSGGANQRQWSVRSITSGPYTTAGGNIVTLEVLRDTPITATEIQAAATALVKRTVTRGRTFDCEAIAAYWLRPGHTITVQLPTGPAEDHLVARVEFNHVDGTMRVTTRLPDNTGTIGA